VIYADDPKGEASLKEAYHVKLHSVRGTAKISVRMPLSMVPSWSLIDNTFELQARMFLNGETIPDIDRFMVDAHIELHIGLTKMIEASALVR